MSKKYYAIQQAEASREADIYIFGDIVQERFFESDVSSTGIVRQIQALDADTLNVHINSDGGSVKEGWAIYNALLEHPAKVITYGDSFVASAALYPFLAGDERYASNLSGYYLHQVRERVEGYSKDLRAAADEADFLTGVGIQAFVDRAGMDPEEVKALMENETWLSPAQALEYGIATAITQDRTPRQLQSAKRDIFQRIFQAAPKSLEQGPSQPQQKEPERNKILQLFERRQSK